MTVLKHPPATVLWLCALLFSGGCATIGDSRHYLMSPVPPAAVPAAARDIHLGIGPVSLPDHLERPNIVSRESSSRVLIAAEHKWAAPLDAHVAGVMAENLRLRLGSDAIPVYPWPPATRVELQLAMEVHELIAQGNQVRLAVRWRLLDRPAAARVDRLTRIEEPAGAGYDAMVDAMARAMGRLADEIAAAVAEASPSRHR